MAAFQRQTKNSTKHNHRQSFNTTPTLTPNRPPITVTQQYTELNTKINQLIESNLKLEDQIGALLGKVSTLETQNQSLTEDNAVLRADNNALSAKLIAAEVRLSSIESDIESSKQKALQKTVELLEAPTEAKEDVLAFIKKYGQEIGCVVHESDLNHFYARTQKTRSNVTKTKIILEFSTLNKRKEFYLAGRAHRFQKTQGERQQQQHHQQQQQKHRRGEYRLIKVVDALTHYKKSIFFDIIDRRKTYKDVIKNVWITDGDIFVRRFGRTLAEPVKNHSFVDLLFPDHRQDE
jgi:regulator of replication initiation timing